MTDPSSFAKSRENEPSRPDARNSGPDLPLVEQVRHENRFLFETVSRLFEFQRDIQAARGKAGAPAVVSVVEGHLESTLGVRLLVLLEGPRADALAEVYRWAARTGGEDKDDTEEPGFSTEELRAAVAKNVPLINPSPVDIAGRDHQVSSTTILFPLANEDSGVRVAMLHLRDAPVEVEGFKLELLRFLLGELTATRLEIASARPGADEELDPILRLDTLRSETFLGLIHDMKTPLTGILSGCELLLVDPAGLSQDQRETLDIIHVSAGRLQSLAGDLLELGSMQSSVADDAMEMQNLVELLESSTEALALQTEKHHIHFESEEESLVLLCQPNRLVRLVENLIGNAVKYSPEGGNVWVRLKREEGTARLSVKDEGIGIAPDEIASIWDRYHRSDNPGDIEGTGLGLSIIKMVVDRHRGRVTVESARGRGTTFTVYLPIVTAGQPVL